MWMVPKTLCHLSFWIHMDLWAGTTRFPNYSCQVCVCEKRKVNDSNSWKRETQFLNVFGKVERMRSSFCYVYWAIDLWRASQLRGGINYLNCTWWMWNRRNSSKGSFIWTFWYNLWQLGLIENQTSFKQLRRYRKQRNGKQVQQFANCFEAAE